MYAIPAVLYLLLGQHDKPAASLTPFMPSNPKRNLKILAHLALLLRDGYRARLLPVFLNSLATRTLNLGPPASASTGAGLSPAVKEDVAYADDRLLDVYLPAAVNGEETVVGAPVIVYVGASNWRLGGRRSGREVGMRLRRLGYAVVVPDLTGWPEGRVEEMVRDLRLVLEWTAGAIMACGGDPERIHLMVSRPESERHTTCSALTHFLTCVDRASDPARTSPSSVALSNTRAFVFAEFDRSPTALYAAADCGPGSGGPLPRRRHRRQPVGLYCFKLRCTIHNELR